MSLLALYALGGYLVSQVRLHGGYATQGSQHCAISYRSAYSSFALQGLMPCGVLISGIGFTYSLTYATQGVVNTLTDLRRASGAFQRVRSLVQNSEPDPSMYGALPPGETCNDCFRPTKRGSSLAGPVTLQ